MRSGVFPLSKNKNDMEIKMPTKNTEEQQAELFEVQINKTRWLNPDADYSDKLKLKLANHRLDKHHAHTFVQLTALHEKLMDEGKYAEAGKVLEMSLGVVRYLGEG